eukprot:1159707-Pelagomonas_calceolata.AAC.1
METMHQLCRADQIWGGVIGALELWAFLLRAKSCFCWAYWRDSRPIVSVAVFWMGFQLLYSGRDGGMYACLGCLKSHRHAKHRLGYAGRKTGKYQGLILLLPEFSTSCK